MKLSFEKIHEKHSDEALQLVCSAYDEEKWSVECLPDKQAFHETIQTSLFKMKKIVICG